MILYHGSPFRIDTPDLAYAKRFRDFGPGFYLAEEEIDAVTIAIKNTWKGYLHVYELDDGALGSLAVVEFEGFTDEWLRFVYDNRMGFEDELEPFDVAIGPTAGGKVNDIFETCRRHSSPYDAVKSRLASEITNTHFGYQWSLASDGALGCLELLDVEEITSD